MPSAPTLDQLRSETEGLVKALRKGVVDIRRTVEVSKDVIRTSRDTLQSARELTAFLPFSDSD